MIVSIFSETGFFDYCALVVSIQLCGVGMMVIVSIFSETGFFDYCALVVSIQLCSVRNDGDCVYLLRDWIL